MGDKKRTAKITEDFLAEANVEAAIKSSIEGQKEIDTDEFYEQLKDFLKDRSYVDRFRGCSLKGRWGIEIFKFRPNKKLETKLFLTDMSGSLLSMDKIAKATHIAKIIKAPADLQDGTPQYKEGQLVMLSPSETVGESFNPDYLLLTQFSQSNMEPKLPEGMKKFTDKIVSVYYEYAFLPPHEFNKPSQEVTTFAIDGYKIIGHYEIPS